MANEQTTEIDTAGEIDISVRTDTGTQVVKARRVLYVPNLSTNLLSVKQMVEYGHRVVFENNICTIYEPNGDVLARAAEENGVYKLLDR